VAGLSRLSHRCPAARTEKDIHASARVRGRIATALLYRPVRSRSDRVIAGVAGGLAERLGIDAVLVRLAFVVLSFAGGFGVAAYLFCWARGTDDPAQKATPVREPPLRLAALGMIFAGLLLLLREAGRWFGDALVLSVTLASAGSAIIWTRNAGFTFARRGRSNGRGRHAPLRSGRLQALRVLAGLPLIVGGMAMFLQANRALAAARNLAFAVVVTVVGFALVFGPWIWRLGRQLAFERGERIRSEERADMAAHLHDSVLQTLALIQRNRDPERMATLARAQERELRSWLYGKSRGDDGKKLLSSALDERAGRIERLHRIPVEVVVVGDRAMDASLRALVEAAGEAMHNAAKHSGATVVSVYLEVEDDVVRVYVRDEGRGFLPSSVPGHRRGIAESIRGRMERYGGVAVVESLIGEGTEVRLEMSLKPR
jgi:signal transduction histidine kinase/phage shock protein PspC (stress-responsive transcriptional regulator)